MEQSQLDEFKELLENNLQEIADSYDIHLATLLSLKHRTDIEKADWSQKLEDEAVEETIVENDQNFALKISHALKRIEAGTYGKCEACNREIPIERLRAKPSVSLCISCQEKKDNGQLQLG